MQLVNSYTASLLLALVLLGACESSPRDSGTAIENKAHTRMIVENDVPVTMRDGVVLMSNIYRPDSDQPLPVLVYRTPYGKDAAARGYTTHRNAVARGYVVVLQDVRGRYRSQGIFEPYQNEALDGYDTIEWAAAQPWSNGRIGTYGLSYPGAVQWLAAVTTPPHLEAMAPAMTFSTPGNFFYMNGVFDLSWLPWIYTSVAPDARVRLDLPGIRSETEAEAMWLQVAHEYRSHLPLSELPYLREEAPFYFEWLEHRPDDPWWNWADVRGKYQQVNAAVLNLSGWYDESYGPEGAITNHKGLLASRKDAASPRSHLVLGPWVHGVSSTMTGKTGSLDFGPSAGIDYDGLLLEFFDHYLKDQDNAFAQSPPVRQFEMGANRWREQYTWPQTGTISRSLFLGAGGDDRGLLEWTPPRGQDQSAFRSDPEDPVTDPYGILGPHDYQTLTGREDMLVFDSAVLEKDVIVSGASLARLYVSCDCRDFDLWVKLLDVHPDGKAYNLMSPGADVLRASYRDPGKGRQLLEPRAVYQLELPGLITSNRFLAGHRIRVLVSGAFSPHFSRNLQTGESEAISAASQPATITIHHSSQYPSQLILPVNPPEH